MRVAISILTIGLLVLAACAGEQTNAKTFDACVAEGNPVMESFPRQCRFADGTTVTEIIEEDLDEGLDGLPEEPAEMPRGKLAAPMAVCADDERRADAERVGYRCVETCPDGYDAYMTQIALQVCIAHLGADEFATMATCERSTDCPSESVCIKTTRATDGEGPLADLATYRCAPQPYYDYLLQTSGAATLDEDGEESVAIA